MHPYTHQSERREEKKSNEFSMKPIFYCNDISLSDVQCVENHRLNVSRYWFAFIESIKWIEIHLIWFNWNVEVDYNVNENYFGFQTIEHSLFNWSEFLQTNIKLFILFICRYFEKHQTHPYQVNINFCIFYSILKWNKKKKKTFRCKTNSELYSLCFLLVNSL